jgi:hypothetical protein
VRDLTSKHNVQNISDTIGGGIVQLHYRLPTTEERFGFAKACLVQDGDDVKYDSLPARLEYGLKVLTGFRHGDLQADDKLFSSDPEHEDYREDWKKLLEETSADLIMALAMGVFEGTHLLSPKKKKEKQEVTAGKIDKAEGDAPLASNSDD